MHRSDNIMTTIQIQSNTKVPLDDVLNGVAALETPELEDFFHKVAQVLAERKSSHLSESESELLRKINAGYPQELTKRYEYLLTQKKKQALSSGEQQEMVEISDQFEAFDALRMEHLLALSQLRNMPLEQLLKNLKQPSAA
ncbi:MAG: hypothetical protein WCR52_03940 [Bacteroidota bacterium]